MIGLCITTFNSEGYFDTLFQSLPLDKIDHIVVVNGGKPYEKDYASIDPKIKWIQHPAVQYPSVARNDGLRYLMEKNCDHYFICEDDMIILDHGIFNTYINSSNVSGIQYLCHASNAWETGPRFARTPRMVVQYSENTTLNFYAHTCNEFTYRTKEMLKTVGLYDEGLRCMFDIDSLIRMCRTSICSPFWYFPDVADSDKYITNNPDAVSRMNAEGERAATLLPEHQRIYKKYGMGIGSIPLATPHEFVQKIKAIQPIK